MVGDATSPALVAIHECLMATDEGKETVPKGVFSHAAGLLNIFADLLSRRSKRGSLASVCEAIGFTARVRPPT